MKATLLGLASGLSSAIGVTKESRVRYVGPGRRAEGGPIVWLFLCGATAGTGIGGTGICGRGKSGIVPIDDTVEARDDAIRLGAADCGGVGSYSRADGGGWFGGAGNAYC